MIMAEGYSIVYGFVSGITRGRTRQGNHYMTAIIGNHKVLATGICATIPEGLFIIAFCAEEVDERTGSHVTYVERWEHA